MRPNKTNAVLGPIAVPKPDTNNANYHTDNRGPKREEEEEPWTNRIGVRIGPQANCRCDDDEHQWKGAQHKQGKADFDPSRLQVGIHCARTVPAVRPNETKLTGRAGGAEGHRRTRSG